MDVVTVGAVRNVVCMLNARRHAGTGIALVVPVPVGIPESAPFRRNDEGLLGKGEDNFCQGTEVASGYIWLYFKCPLQNQPRVLASYLSTVIFYYFTMLAFS